MLTGTLHAMLHWVWFWPIAVTIALLLMAVTGSGLFDRRWRKDY